MSAFPSPAELLARAVAIEMVAVDQGCREEFGCALILQGYSAERAAEMARTLPDNDGALQMLARQRRKVTADGACQVSASAIYVRFSDDGRHIRKWSFEPFEGGTYFEGARWAAQDNLYEAQIIRLVANLIWHVEQVCGPLSTENHVVKGDSDRSILEHNFRAILSTCSNAADEPKPELVCESTHAIEISFGAPVHVSAEQQRRLIAVLDDICRSYEGRHPDRVMWTAGWGDKIEGNIFCLEDDEPIPFNDRIFAIECAERERFEGEQH